MNETEKIQIERWFGSLPEFEISSPSFRRRRLIWEVNEGGLSALYLSTRLALLILLFSFIFYLI